MKDTCYLSNKLKQILLSLKTDCKSLVKDINRADLNGLKMYKGVLEDKLKGIGEWFNIMTAIGKDALNCSSDCEDLLVYEGRMASALELVLILIERQQSIKDSHVQGTKVQGSVRPKAQRISGVEKSHSIDKEVNKLASKVKVLGFSDQGAPKWEKLPHVVIRIEESDAETEPRPVPAKRHSRPKPTRDFGIQTEIVEVVKVCEDGEVPSKWG